MTSQQILIVLTAAEKRAPMLTLPTLLRVSEKVFGVHLSVAYGIVFYALM